MQVDIGHLRVSFFSDIFGGDYPRIGAVDQEIVTIVGNQSSLWVESDSQKELFKFASEIRENNLLQ